MPHNCVGIMDTWNITLGNVDIQCISTCIYCSPSRCRNDCLICCELLVVVGTEWELVAMAFGTTAVDFIFPISLLLVPT